ncbi:MAG: hypothetical protein ACR2JW_08185 [Thermomicrobiales bacterium]
MFSWGNNRIGPTGVADAQRRAQALADLQRQEVDTLDEQARQHPTTRGKRVAWFLFNVTASFLIIASGVLAFLHFGVVTMILGLLLLAFGVPAALTVFTGRADRNIWPAIFRRSR